MFWYHIGGKHWDKEEKHLVLTLNAKPLDSWGVDEKPSPIVKLANAQHHGHSLTTFCDEPITVYSCKRNGVVGHIGEAQYDSCC